jgi:hypothetical protein
MLAPQILQQCDLNALRHKKSRMKGIESMQRTVFNDENNIIGRMLSNSRLELARGRHLMDAYSNSQ